MRPVSCPAPQTCSLPYSKATAQAYGNEARYQRAEAYYLVNMSLGEDLAALATDFDGEARRRSRAAAILGRKLLALLSWPDPVLLAFSHGLFVDSQYHTTMVPSPFSLMNRWYS